MHPRVTIIFGGAASGKSVYAEKFTETLAKPKTYLATSQVLDGEMQSKINIHQARRSNDWTLVEEPLELFTPLSRVPRNAVCLIDCATMWLSNHMVAGNELDAAQSRLFDAIDNCSGHLVIVSNEVGMGIVPDNAMAREFREAQGRLNSALAARADLAVFVVAGLPLVLKGTLP